MANTSDGQGVDDLTVTNSFIQTITGKFSIQGSSRLASRIGSNIQKISKNAKDIERLTRMLGTPEDSGKHRKKLEETQHKTNQLVKDTDQMLKDLNASPISTNQSDARQQKLHEERLASEFRDTLNQFQRAQREAAKVVKERMTRARGASESVNPYADGASNQHPFLSGEFDGSSTAHSQLQADEMEALVVRENQLKQLESDILDVNQIIQSVAVMIGEQGEMIDSIEASVESAEVYVEQANTQLRKTREYQKKARRKKFYLIICLIIVLLIVALILYSILR